ncbi:hypothetical protein JZK55_16790 [Dissulfurispira thermophila]|uniref:SHSP domain-containing protein n=2 Tax=root TaxID=1 RepID=A0A7G1H4W9_9BACT|nr:Hsp20/alpha crystallin family protein [Dissulfurispira thermophila]BCB96757.1 hypothetical protein JZK55_16790 [Dissulfurispira thermophila]
MRNVLKGLFYYEAETCIAPLIDIYETKNDLVFECDLPGVDPDNLSIRAYEDLLIIEGVITDADVNSSSGSLKYLCMERGIKEFRRVIKLPVHVNTVAGEAFYSRGVLTVKFPLLKGKMIKIKIQRK